MALYAFYGTLRKNQPNYRRLYLNKKAKYLGTHTIPGYAMFGATYPFPFVAPVPGVERGDYKIVVDVFDITDEYTCKFIDLMELGAGYRKSSVEINGMDCVIYISSKGFPGYPESQRIKSGDWVLFQTSQAVEQMDEESEKFE